MVTINPNNAPFFASWDDINTTIPWSRPNLDSLIRIKDTILKKYNGLDGIDMYVVGGYAEYLHKPTNPLTWDIDINLVLNKSFEASYLKQILDDLLRIGLDNRIFLDLKVMEPYLHEFWKELAITGCLPEHKKEDLVYYKNYRWFTKIRNGIQETRNKAAGETVEVYNGLFKVTGYTPRLFKKVIDKVNNNIYSGEVINLKTTDFNFTI
tara:strand:+ start:38 stop:664 length:627 start_codon:yes stop_codon:yes gene_type:complete